MSAPDRAVLPFLLIPVHWTALLPAEPQSTVAFTGAGGKTSLLLQLAAALRQQGRPVIITTTTKMFHRPGDATVLQSAGPQFLRNVRRALERHGRVVAARGLDRATNKLLGLDPDMVPELRLHCPDATLLVEADGAAHKPLKAPAPHEPVIPPGTGRCVGVMGLDALHRPLREDMVHRVELFSGVTGLAPGGSIAPRHLLRLARHPEGLFRNCPHACSRLVVLNKLDCLARSGALRAFQLRRGETGRWFAASVRKNQLFPFGEAVERRVAFQ